MRSARFIFLVSIGAVLAGSEVIAADFLPIGFLNPADNISHVAGLASDGGSVLGESYRLGDVNVYPRDVHGALFRWSAGTGISPLVQPSSPAFSGLIEPTDQSWINAISRDGSTILFNRSTYEPTGAEGDYNYFGGRYLWSPSYGVQDVYESTPNLLWSYVFWNGLSSDGRKRVGTISGDIYVVGHRNSSAVVWGDDGYWLPLGQLPGGPTIAPISQGLAMSADGSVVVGYSTSVNAPGPSDSTNYISVITPIDQVTPPPPAFAGNAGYEAFAWTPADGMIGLGDLPGGDFASEATGVSSNGQFIIGTGSVYHGREAFVWTKDGGMVGLGFLNPNYPYTAPAAASNNGIIVGTGLVSREIAGYYLPGLPFYKDTLAAFVWDADHGMRDLKNVLEQQYGLDLEGWQLTSVAGISDDGLTIAGNGINPLGHEQGWVVQLQAVPEPSTMAFLLIAAALKCPRRRGTSHRNRR